MTLSVTSWPTSGQIDGYAEAMPGIEREEIVRDIVRLVSVADMVHRDILNEDWVLAGGIAMRLRGSPRFTRLDTDSSKRGELPTASELMNALRFDSDDLTITPAGLEDKNEIKHVAPVEFQPFFDALGSSDPDPGAFRFTVSGRGLIEAADEVDLAYPYPDLVLPAMKVPLMNLTEQVAEKICGWCAHGLLKHYVDVAWAFDTLMRKINVDRFAPLVEAKLAKRRELFPYGYRTLTGITALLGPLNNPDDHVPPMGNPENDKRTSLRFSTASVDYQRAKVIMRNEVLPHLVKSAAESKVK
jgi:nucleotidyltransferase AbiEii toxin of type IV toxin-antitoxin system